MSARPPADRLLDVAVPVVVLGAVLAGAAGFADVDVVRRTGSPARWALLAGLLALAVAAAFRSRRQWRFPPVVALALAAFCGLSLVSTAWSVNAHGTLERAVAETAVVAAFALLAGCTAAHPLLGPRLLDAVLAGAAVVAASGFVLWLVHPSQAMIPVTSVYPSRYKGIELSPNTAPLLLAIASPLALWRALDSHGIARRGLLVVVLLGFAASIGASGSRGAMLAAYVALLAVLALVRRSGRRRIALAGIVTAGLIVTAWASTIPKALAKPPHSSTTPTLRQTRNAELILPLSEEIGNPWWTHRAGGAGRSLFNTSVRMRALTGSVDRALERPALGFGFGAEQWAFVNRYYAFSSGNPENGYVGILLQVGVVGAVLWVVVLASCVVPGVRECVRGARDHPFAVGAVGAAVGALAMGVSESFFHGVGGIAYVPLWTALLLCAGAGMVRRSAVSSAT